MTQYKSSRILVVDDHQPNLDALADMVEYEGLTSGNDCQVDRFDDSNEAIKSIQENTYGLIITDIEMEPNPDGIVVCQTALSSAIIPRILIHSGYDYEIGDDPMALTLRSLVKNPNIRFHQKGDLNGILKEIAAFFKKATILKSK